MKTDTTAQEHLGEVLSQLSKKAEGIAAKESNMMYDTYLVIMFPKVMGDCNGVLEYDTYQKGYVLDSPDGLRGNQLKVWGGEMKTMLKEEGIEGLVHEQLL